MGIGLRAFERRQGWGLTGFIGGLGTEGYTGQAMNKHIAFAASLITLLAAHSAHAQLVVPGRAIPILPVMPFVAPILPMAPVITPILPQPAHPVLPIPTLPGVPAYRLIVPVAAAQPVKAAELGAAVPVAAFGKAVVETDRAGELRPSAPTRAIERAQRGFGLRGKKVDAPRLQAMFDGTDYGVGGTDAVVIVEEIERPQTLPESDLMREIGVAYPGK